MSTLSSGHQTETSILSVDICRRLNLFGGLSKFAKLQMFCYQLTMYQKSPVSSSILSVDTRRRLNLRFILSSPTTINIKSLVIGQHFRSRCYKGFLFGGLNKFASNVLLSIDKMYKKTPVSSFCHTLGKLYVYI